MKPGAFVLFSSDPQSLRANRAPFRSGGLCVWFQGFVAEAKDLAGRVGMGAGTRPAPEALIASCYRRWGPRLTAEVIGEFAFGLWDRDEDLLLLATDSLGVTPLYFQTRNDGLLAGSDLGALLAETGEATVEPEYIAQHLRLARHLPGITPYKGIERLAPGRWLSRLRGRTTQGCSWRLADVPSLTGVARGELDGRFRDLMRRATSAHLTDAEATLCELSGGLDSSSIAAVAWSGGPSQHPKAVISVAYPRSPASDESLWMDEVLACCPYRSIRLDGDSHAAFSAFPRRFVAEPGSVIVFAALAEAYERAARREGSRFILSGNGGDHVLMGDSPDPLFLADDLAGLHLRRLFNSARAWQASEGRRASSYHLWNHALRPFLARSMGREVMRSSLPDAPPWLSEDFRRWKVSTLPAPADARAAPSVGGQYFIERVLRFADVSAHNFQPYVADFTYRYPLLFRPLVEFLYAVPWTEKLHPQADRLLQRRAMKGVLPETVRLRRGKRGPDASLLQGLRGSKPWLDLLADQPRLVEDGYVDSHRWGEALALARAGHMRLVSLFVQAATLEYWLRNLADRPRRTPGLNAIPPT